MVDLTHFSECLTNSYLFKHYYLNAMTLLTSHLTYPSPLYPLMTSLYQSKPISIRYRSQILLNFGYDLIFFRLDLKFCIVTPNLTKHISQISPPLPLLTTPILKKIIIKIKYDFFFYFEEKYII